MIVVRLSDGLGNQMFQYAMGRKLAEELNTDLRFDTRWYDENYDGNGPDRTLTLNEFNLSLQPASTQDIRTVIGLGTVSTPAARFVSRFAPRLAGKFLNYYREILDQPRGNSDSWPHRRRYSSRLLSIEDDAYLHGYWQSPGYFESIKSQLERDFSVTGLRGQNASVHEEIAESESVGIHVRRGDFVEYGNTLPQEYYEEAISIIESQIDNPEYYVFSNGIEWARKNLPVEEATYVDWNDGSTDYIDLYLLSQCRHTIMANSTFSWWGSWLHEESNDVVVTPSKWWNASEPVDEMWDFIPNHWDQVEPWAE